MHNELDLIQQTKQYHERTKHHPNAYAKSLGYLDWESQPNPFRRFEGAPYLPLDIPAPTDEPSYDALYSVNIQPEDVTRESIGRLLYDSLALSAWKEASPGNRWSLRVNPSSGDLHPTEGYLLVGPRYGLDTNPAVYHYSPYEHALEQRRILYMYEWEQIAKQLPTGGFLIALSSIYWRESWKYGERAFRYCHHDVGHAIGTVAMAASALGWQSRLISTIPDRELNILLGCHQQCGPEAEHSDCILAIYPSQDGTRSSPQLELPEPLINRLAKTTPHGTRNKLSLNHQPWPIIDEVSSATVYGGQLTDASDRPLPAFPEWTGKPYKNSSARELIHQRRSAVAMDGRTQLNLNQFYRILSRASPLNSPFPSRVLPWRPRISLVLFVHRVRDLTPGLYILVRHPAHSHSLRNALDPAFVWEKPGNCPHNLAFYQLQPGDAREAAKIISCHQDIAADGVFSLGMLAEFEASLSQGTWFYPRLFWEAGLLGQVLYLEAEAAGIRATGIGCFFDDMVHQLLGITNSSWQSLYHFTVGGAIDDPRIRTLHPYFHKGMK